MQSLIVLIDYFGGWPQWMPVFLASCAANPSVDWLIHSDCPPPPEYPPNVRFVKLSWQDYISKVSNRLDIRFRPYSTYSICNIRPAFGVVHREYIAGYPFFGWGDLDVIYGDIIRNYSYMMQHADIISNDDRICSGHLMILRNVEWVREAFMLIGDWRELLERHGPTEWKDSLDEARLSSIFNPNPAIRREFSVPQTGDVADKYWRRSVFKKQWVTPFVPLPWIDGSRHHPEKWRWQSGTITNSHDGSRDFPYLHLMNFRSPRFIDTEIYGTSRTWEDGATMPNCEQTVLERHGVEISRDGILLLSTDLRSNGRSITFKGFRCP